MPSSKLLEAIIEEEDRNKEAPLRLVQQAWAEPESRGVIVAMMLESLKKLGGFEKIPFWMNMLSASLACDQIAGLYEELRSRSVRNEIEWRLAFQAAFSQCEELPPVEEKSIRTYDLEDALLAAARRNAVDEAPLYIECMLRVGSDPLAIRVASSEDLGLSADDIEEMNADDLTALIKKTNKERGIPIRDYAAGLGHADFVKMLDAIRMS